MAWLKGNRGAGGIEVTDDVEFRGNTLIKSGANWSPTRRKHYYVDGIDGNDSRDGRSPSNALLTITQAITNAGNDDIIYVDSARGTDYEWSATQTWSYYSGGIIGNQGTPMNPMIEISMADATTFSPMLTVSGRGNVFANLQLKHGSSTGYATDLVCTLVSGRYNYFDNVYFYGPLYAEQDVAATYKGVQITGHNNYFRGCKFGSDGLNRDKANWNVSIEGGVGNMFEDCFFQMGADGTAPFFVQINSNTRDMKYTTFKNCTFYVHSANYGTTISYAIDGGYQANTAGVILDRCNFVNVGQVSDTDKDVWIWKTMYEGENDADTTKISMIALRNQGV